MPPKPRTQLPVELTDVQHVLLLLAPDGFHVQAPYRARIDGGPDAPDVVAFEADEEPELDAAVRLIYARIVARANDHAGTPLDEVEQATVGEAIAARVKPGRGEVVDVIEAPEGGK